MALPEERSPPECDGYSDDRDESRAIAATATTAIHVRIHATFAPWLIPSPPNNPCETLAR